MNDAERFDLAEVRAEQERQAMIDQAKARIAAEGSILCSDCGEAIAETRRRALPSARRCISCQVLHEQHMPRSR